MDSLTNSFLSRINWAHGEGQHDFSDKKSENWDDQLQLIDVNLETKEDILANLILIGIVESDNINSYQS